MKIKLIRSIFLTALKRRLNQKHKKKSFSKWSPSKGWISYTRESVFTVCVYSAATGEKFKAKVRNFSKRKFQNAMKAGERIILDSLYLPKNSTVRSFTEKEWEQYPVLVQLGKCKVPYIIHQARLQQVGNRVLCAAFLSSIDNISYFQAITAKKALTSAKKPVILKQSKPKRKGKK